MDWYSSSSDSETASTRAYKLAPFARLRDHPKRSATILTHISLGGLLFASVFGIILSGIVFSPITVLVEGECLGQSFVFFACILTLVYIGLHVASARQNYSILRSQAFQHPLHSWTIIIVRLTLGTWAAALLAVAVGVAKAPTRVPLLGLDLFVTTLGL
ncbi:hypothetical protein GQ53DRAFT_180094 [Thozetella sp. PMI_491]|nr:hypothetical protein GQ53DRAFT_180094 [Thozetella sp. PMI_491]